VTSLSVGLLYVSNCVVVVMRCARKANIVLRNKREDDVVCQVLNIPSWAPTHRCAKLFRRHPHSAFNYGRVLANEPQTVGCVFHVILLI